MTTLSRSAALCAAFACSLAAAPACAERPYDPAAQNVDAICDAYLPSAQPRDVVRLARLEPHDGSVPNWRRSDAATNDRLQREPDGAAGAFATIVFDRGGIVYAAMTDVDADGTSAAKRTWCFIGGKLSRTTIEIADASGAHGWRRTQYYGDDLARPLSDYVEWSAPQAAVESRDRPPPDRLFVFPYATPAKLPFADVAAKLHSGAPASG